MGKKTKAIQTWRKVLKIKSNAEPMLALAAAIHSLNKDNLEALELAKKALTQNPDYVLTEFHAKQLWGKTSQGAAVDLFAEPKLKEAIEFGFDQLKQIQTDPDLKNLRKSDEFKNWAKTLKI